MIVLVAFGVKIKIQGLLHMSRRAFRKFLFDDNIFKNIHCTLLYGHCYLM